VVGGSSSNNKLALVSASLARPAAAFTAGENTDLLEHIVAGEEETRQVVADLSQQHLGATESISSTRVRSGPVFVRLCKIAYVEAGAQAHLSLQWRHLLQDGLKEGGFASAVRPDQRAVSSRRSSISSLGTIPCRVADADILRAQDDIA